MITKYCEVVCDCCGEVISHYSTSSLKEARQWAMDDGAVTEGKKIFCNERCLVAHRSDWRA